MNDDTRKELELDKLDDEPINGPESVRGESLVPEESGDGDPPTPRVLTPPPPLVTKPTPEALRGSRREPTWAEETASGPNTSDDRISALGVPRNLGHVPAPTSGPRILVVDDDRDTRDSLRPLLEDDGYNVVEAVNGLDGLERLFEMYPRLDLVIVDLEMPKINGLELARVVMKSYASEVPMLFISGNQRPTRGELDDTFLFIRKGHMEDVLDVIRRQIDEGRERRRAFGRR